MLNFFIKILHDFILTLWPKVHFLPDSRSSRNSASTSTGTKSSRSARNLAENVTGSLLTRGRICEWARTKAEHAGGCHRKKERVDLWRRQFHAEARELGRWRRSSFTRTARRTGRGSFHMLKPRHPEGDARSRKSSF